MHQNYNEVGGLPLPTPTDLPTPPQILSAPALPPGQILSNFLGVSTGNMQSVDGLGEGEKGQPAISLANHQPSGISRQSSVRIIPLGVVANIYNGSKNKASALYGASSSVEGHPQSQPDAFQATQAATIFPALVNSSVAHTATSSSVLESPSSTSQQAGISEVNSHMPLMERSSTPRGRSREARTTSSVVHRSTSRKAAETAKSQKDAISSAVSEASAIEDMSAWKEHMLRWAAKSRVCFVPECNHPHTKGSNFKVHVMRHVGARFNHDWASFRRAIEGGDLEFK
ncbi:hypothetical protein BJ742DRAFT_778986 [Cladochytrium replicatum]|nr:hypothetical protein BJ742DRAFT_778986 [Cladochytrium replicatum]